MAAEVVAAGALAAAAVWVGTGGAPAPTRDRAPDAVHVVLERMGRAVGEEAARLRALVSGARHAGGAVAAREVSDMVDVVRLGLRAGLTFDAALDLFCAHRATPLSQRMRQAQFSWQVGLATREDALREAARELRVPALGVFGATVCQALAFGAPVSDALLAQSREIREANRAEIERAIERAPVKILIPTGTLILPALLLAILGPLLSASGMM